MKTIQPLVFFGSHELASPALDTLAELGFVPQLIVTRPKAGLPSSDESTPPHPVVDWAREHGVKAIHSRRAADPDLRDQIAALEPDLLVVVDFGNPLPAEILAVPRRGTLEVHPSLLPKLRGAHALRAALAANEKKTGVTVIEASEEPWGGPILLQEELEIEGGETFGKLLPKAAELSCRLLDEALTKVSRAKKMPRGRPQKEDAATHTPRIGGRHRKAPWSLEAPRVQDRMRAYSPPALQAFCKYRQVEIHAGKAMDWVEAPYGATGTYLGMRQGKLAILCGRATVFGIERLRWPGGEVQGASDFAYKEQLSVGDRFV